MRKCHQMSRFALTALFALICPITGCGYHSVNSAVHLPQTVHTLDVPTFANHTQSFHTEVSFTNAVIREFTSRTPYKVLATDKPDAGDALLEGDRLGVVQGAGPAEPRAAGATADHSSFLITSLLRPRAGAAFRSGQPSKSRRRP